MATQNSGAASQNGNDGVASRQPMDFNEDRKEGEAAFREEKTRARNPRDELMDSYGDRLAETRKVDEEYFLRTGGARAAAMAAELRAKADEGAESIGEVEPPSGEATAAGDKARAATPPADPYADMFVVQDGKRMMKMKVDGKETLVPIERAVGQMQKGVAAEIRLQQASQVLKDANAEAARLRTPAVARTSQPPVQPDVDDQALDNEAKILVKSLLTDSEDEAAVKVAKVLKTVRQAASPPRIDVKAIADEAASAAEQRIETKRQNKAIQTGYEQFQVDYPEVAQDANLFRVADEFSTSIAEEHPEWSPERVMDESGKATREWVAKLTGKPAVKTNSEGSGRQERKESLRPMPPARGAQQPLGTQKEPDETPASVLAEIRKGRGQAS